MEGTAVELIELLEELKYGNREIFEMPVQIP
jgi:hypothetical protein